MVEMNSVFAGCNRSLNVFEYNYSKRQFAYSSYNNVLISNEFSDLKNVEEGKEIVQVLNCESEITCLKWINKYLIVGCLNGELYIYDENVKLVEILKPTDCSISCVDLNENENLLIVGDTKGKVFYYNLEAKLELISSLELPYGFYSMTIKVCKVENSSGAEYLVFIGGSKPLIHILYVNDNALELVNSLPGHEDWVRTLDIRQIEDSPREIEGVVHYQKNFIIASGSLDRIIRLWKLKIEDINLPDVVEKNKLKLLTSKEFKFNSPFNKFNIKLDAILMGHDDWISKISWKRGINNENELMLLSSSADSSIMLWKMDLVSGVWFPKFRIGEMAIKGASTATGSSGGFYDSQWVVEGDDEVIITNGKTGSIRCWIKEEEEFRSVSFFNGSIKSITDLSWSPNGEYLLSTSLDQSTRMYCKYKGKYFEFCRPQIHGFDMITVKCLNNFKFISAGDEKVIRVFEMPKKILNMLNSIIDEKIEVTDEEENKLSNNASLPVLGLSNKGEEEIDDENAELNLLENINDVPVEDILQRFTLWPEIEKLYGHGFEITTIDISNDSKILASACRSNNIKHSVIRLFDIESWLEVGKLEGHDLTITRLKFSNKTDSTGPSSEYLLSVSRDRKFSVWKKQGKAFKLIKLMEKAHSRIIWDCTWLNFEDSKLFLTCSRDKEVKLWEITEDDSDVILKNSVKFTSSVTAIDSIKMKEDNKFKVIIGLDNGDVLEYEVNTKLYEFEKINGDSKILSGNNSGESSISRICIRPLREVDDSIVVGIGSKDSSLRIITL